MSNHILNLFGNSLNAIRISLLSLFVLFQINTFGVGLTNNNIPLVNAVGSGFEENKGQFLSTAGEEIPFVYYTLQSEGISIYLTKKGLTYLFIKPESMAGSSILRDTINTQLENYKYQWHRVDMELEDASISPDNIIKELPTAADQFYYIGNRERIAAKQYQKITIKNIYPNIDWVLYFADNKNLKYDFVIHPGGDYKKIKLLYIGADKVAEEKTDEITIQTPLGTIKDGHLYCYTKENEQEVKSAYSIQATITKPKDDYTGALLPKSFSAYEVTFNLNNFAHQSQTLVIDPRLVWSTLFAGSGANVYASARDMCTDVNGNLFIGGSSRGPGFPVLNASTYYNGSVINSPNYGFVSKFTNTGVLLWSTYFGSTNCIMYNPGICTDVSGNVYMTGSVSGVNFPTQNTGTYYDNTWASAGLGDPDAFIIEFNSNGVRQWATYFGGLRLDEADDVYTDSKGNLFIIGMTRSTDFPIQNGGGYFDNTINGGRDVFIAKFDNLHNLLWSTYYGGSAGNNEPKGLCVDALDNLFIVGQTSSLSFPLQNAGTYFQSTNNGIAMTWDIFISKFSNNGNLLWSTYLGGSAYDSSTDICVDKQNNIFIEGITSSSNFPFPSVNGGAGAYFDNSISGSHDALFLKFDNNGNYLWGTLFGGNQQDGFLQGPTPNSIICTDDCGNMYACITTSSFDIETTEQPCDNTAYTDSTHSGSCGLFQTDQMILKFSNGGKLHWSTFWGGEGWEQTGSISIDPFNNLFISGDWGSFQCTTVPIFPFVNPGNNAYFDDAIGIGRGAPFISKFAPPVYDAVSTPASCICDGTANLTVNGTPFNTTGSCNMPFTWKANNNSVVGTTAALNNLCSGNYSVEISDSINCVFDTAYINVTSNISIISLIGNSTSATCGNNNGSVSVTPSGGFGNYTYNWSVAGNTNAGISNLAAGIYSATISDENHCSTLTTLTITSIPTITVIPFIIPVSCFGENDGSATANITGAGPSVNYSWNNGQTTATATGLRANTFSVTVTNNVGCSTQTTVTITEPPLLTATLSAIDPICYNGLTGSVSISLAGGTIPYFYSWNNGQTTANVTGIGAGVYTATVMDNNGCIFTQNAIVSNPAQFIITIPPVTKVCEGQQATINTSLAGGTSPFNYLWSNGQTTALISPAITSTISYSVIVTDANGCLTQAVTTVAPYPLPIVNFTSDNTQGCGPLCINFLNTTPNTNTQQWSFGNNNFSSSQNFNHCYTTPGNYPVTLTVSDNNGCSNGLTQNNYITVHPNPIASFIAKPQTTTLLNPTVNFTDQSHGAISWAWNFGDVNNSSASIQNTNYTYQDTGSYKVQLIVSNEFGCLDTSYEFIEIKADFALYVPNTFTPNGDGMNDIFSPLGTGIETGNYELYIYDRWGDLIFQSGNIMMGWNGKANNGTLTAQEDTYVWIIKLTDILGEKHRYAGHINLIK